MAKFGTFDFGERFFGELKAATIAITDYAIDDTLVSSTDAGIYGLSSSTNASIYAVIVSEEV